MHTPPGGRFWMSSAAVDSFIVTAISVVARRAIYPSLLARMVYHVGKPLMLDGNRFLPLTGIPIRNSDRINTSFEVWLPEPFLVATISAKSLTIGSCCPFWWACTLVWNSTTIIAPENDQCATLKL